MQDERHFIIKFDTMNWKMPVFLGVVAAFGAPEIFNRSTSRGVVATIGIIVVVLGIDGSPLL